MRLLRVAVLSCLLTLLLAQVSACSSRSVSQGVPTDAGSGGSAGSAGVGGSGGGSGVGGTSGAAGAGGTGGSSASGGSGGSNLDCVQAVLDETATASTDTAADRFTTSCGSGQAGDVAFQWTAPSTDYYAFDTRGSTFDTVVAVLDGDCTGAELGCNNNVDASPQSEVVVRLVQGQRVIVVVDGHLGAKGDVTLNVTRVTCPSTDLTGQPFPAVLSTVGGTNEHDGACGGAGFAEKSLRWVPETAGLYQFSVSTEAFFPALYLEQGPTCGGQLLQCNDNVVSGYPAQVTRWLEAGQPVTLIVDSANNAGGEFSLDVKKLTDSCPSEQPVTTPVNGVILNDSVAGSKVLSSSCAWAGNMEVGQHPYAERSYPIHINLTNLQFCSYSITADGPYLLYLISGTKCDGQEVSCIEPADTHNLNFSAADNGDYVLVIENHLPFTPTLTYSIATDCP
jgi:hypothetical protein